MEVSTAILFETTPYQYEAEVSLDLLNIFKQRHD